MGYLKFLNLYYKVLQLDIIKEYRWANLEKDKTCQTLQNHVGQLVLNWTTISP